MKTYSLEFNVQALKEWDGLDKTVKEQFIKVLRKRLIEPHIPAARLSKELSNCYKIKLLKLGYRLVYEVSDSRVVVVVISVGKRDRFDAYLRANRRL